jgi:hypothetical protein
MKKVFLLMVASALLVVSGLAQTPDAGSNTDQGSIKGCLGGSDGSYTVAEDGTRQILKISTSSVDLKLHLGQDVSLTGHKTTGTASSGAPDSSFAVTGLSMISEHCAATAVAPAATAAAPVSPSPGTTVIAPAAAAVASAPAASTPAATASPSAATVSTPADAAAPAMSVSPSPTTDSTPAAATVSEVAPVSPSPETVVTPAVDAAVPAANAAHLTQPSAQPSAHPRRRSATQTAAATVPVATVKPASEAVIPTAAAAVTPVAPASPSSETAGTPAAAAAIPTATHKRGSLWLMILFVVLVIALTALAPFVVRWRKRKMLERTDAPNLSLTHEVISDEASSDHDKSEPRKAA